MMCIAIFDQQLQHYIDIRLPNISVCCCYRSQLTLLVYAKFKAGLL